MLNVLRAIKRFILNLKYLFSHDLQLQDYKEQNCVWPLLQYLDYLYRKKPAGVLGMPRIMTAQEILNEIIDKAKLICITAGPTATVLAYDLAKLGYQAVDVGHLAKAYDVEVRKLPENHDMRKTFYFPD